MDNRKYECLKEEINTDITGVKFVDQTSFYLHRLDFGIDSTVCVNGYPACPECGQVLSHHPTEDRWECSQCHTVYTLQELVEAIESEDRLMRFLLEDVDAYKKEYNEG
jgi:ribosomal protein S27AE